MKDSIKDTAKEIVREKYKSLSCCLNEKSQRIWAATEAKSLGWGGITIVHQRTGIDPKTIRRGLKELDDKILLTNGRMRQGGGGRKKLSDKEPALTDDLEALLEPVTRGDPESPLRWTCKSTRKLTTELNKKGYQISQPTVCAMLTDVGYSLQADKKVHEGGTHPDRNRQFQYINRKSKLFQQEGQPVISVDTKKKEKIGNFKNPVNSYYQRTQFDRCPNIYDRGCINTISSACPGCTKKPINILSVCTNPIPIIWHSSSSLNLTFNYYNQLLHRNQYFFINKSFTKFQFI